LIYNEHLLEHLDVESGLRFLRECCRVLQPNGILRVAMPSLESAVEHYQAGSWRDQSWLRLPENQFIRTRAEMLNVFFRAWGHQWIYDRDSVLTAAWKSTRWREQPVAVSAALITYNQRRTAGRLPCT
jgi:predicted SAM-dependent methyltransferase